MNELIKVDCSGEQMKVSARDLHEFLDVGTRYNDWFSRMCEYGFTNGVDFNLLKIERVQNEGHRQVTRQMDDAIMSMDMAKEICMVTRNEKGKVARQYFLQVEKDWNSPDKVMARALKIADQKISQLTERNTALEQQIEQDKPFTDFGLAISTCEGSITIKQMAALLCQRGIKTGEKRLFEELRQDGFLCTSGGYYSEPAQRWMEQKLFEVRTSSYTNKYGNEQITRQSLITAKGIEYLMNYYLRKHGLMELLTVHRRQVTRQRGTRT